MAYVRGDRVVANENAYWEGAIGKHGTVVDVNNPDNMLPGRPIAVDIDISPGGNWYFSEDMLDPEVVES